MWCGSMPRCSGVKQNVTVTSKSSQRLHLPVEPVERVGAEAVGPGQPGAQIGHAEALHPGHGLVEPVILEVEPLAEAHVGRVVARTARAPASASRPRAAGPCRNGGNRTSPPPRGGGSSPARRAAGRRGCTSGCAAPCRSAARRCASGPNPAPPRRRRSRCRPPMTQIGWSVTARISSILAGHSWICQRFQSSGKPCTATASTCVEHALALHVAHEARVDRRHAAEHARQRRILGADRLRRRRLAMSAKSVQSGSSSGSQCDLLLGSFQIIAASIMPALPCGFAAAG